MFVSDEEAAAMYARWCRNWYGVNAKSVVKSKIRALMAKGDRKGVRAWQQVADALEHQTTEVCATVHFKESPSCSGNSFSAASTWRAFQIATIFWPRQRLCVRPRRAWPWPRH